MLASVFSDCYFMEIADLLQLFMFSNVLK